MTSTNCQLENAPAKERSEDTICRPQHRVTQNEHGATLQVALPGVRKEDVKLTLHESNLEIEARRTDDVPDEWQTHRPGHPARRYSLQLRLTRRLDGTQTTASFEAGVLTLKVPIREDAKPREIVIN
jgi:HSP20 family protein